MGVRGRAGSRRSGGRRGRARGAARHWRAERWRARGREEQAAAGARQAGPRRGTRDRQALGTGWAWPGRAGWLWTVHSMHSAFFWPSLTRYCS